MPTSTYVSDRGPRVVQALRTSRIFSDGGLNASVVLTRQRWVHVEY
jgi:hypothetical protein